MTLLYVIILDIGIILIVSAFENKPLRETFSDILNGDITPAADGGVQEQARASSGIGSTILPATGPALPKTTGALLPTQAPDLRR